MFFKKIKLNFMFLLSLLLIIPINVQAYSEYIQAGGDNIGIEINSPNVIVVGTYLVGEKNPAKEAGLNIGDKITKVNDMEVGSIEEMVNVLSDNIGENSVKIDYLRGNKEKTTYLNLVSSDNETYKTGLYVKDSITGVGTLTFIDPNTNIFGALGHEITEKNSGQRLEVEAGKIYESSVTDINPSRDGNPGEKNVTYNSSARLGTIVENSKVGIFGTYEDEKLQDKELYKVASQEDIHLGEASILTVIQDNNIEEFTIEILKINEHEDSTKNILFEITDQRLLETSGGIVQGMSGSPIIQGDYIVGAITHVVVDDTTKGYGVFITKMLEEAEN